MRPDYQVRTAIVIGALLLAWLGQPAGAQNCKDLPPGPDKRQCVMQSHPEAFERKKERCVDLAEARGASDKGAKKDFVQSCMQGKVSQ